MTEPLKLQLTKDEILAIGADAFGKQLPENLENARVAALTKAAELNMSYVKLLASAILDRTGTVSAEEVEALNALPFRE